MENLVPPQKNKNKNSEISHASDFFRVFRFYFSFIYFESPSYGHEYLSTFRSGKESAVGTIPVVLPAYPASEQFLKNR